MVSTKRTRKDSIAPKMVYRPLKKLSYTNQLAFRFSPKLIDCTILDVILISIITKYGINLGIVPNDSLNPKNMGIDFRINRLARL